MINYYDAHNHLHDSRLDQYRDSIVRQFEKQHIRRMVVNGLHEGDWCGVKALADKVPHVIPSYGLHPWYLSEASPTWLETLEQLVLGSAAAVGEIGLDRRKGTGELAVQVKFFREQLELAASLKRAVSIHCIDAWGPLLSILKESKLPSSGFLMHSYGGSPELAQQLVKLGAYFSFPGSFLHPTKRRKLETFRTIPVERLLIETDAPDQLPPNLFNDYPLGQESTVIHNPLNIIAIYRGLSTVLDIEVDTLACQVEKNFLSLFSTSV